MSSTDLLKLQLSQSASPIQELVKIYGASSSFSAPMILERLGIEFFNEKVLIEALTQLTEKPHTPQEQYVLEQLLCCVPLAVYARPEFLEKNANLLTQSFLPPIPQTSSGSLAPKRPGRCALLFLSALWLMASSIQKSSIYADLMENKKELEEFESMASSFSHLSPLQISGLNYRYNLKHKTLEEVGHEIYEKDRKNYEKQLPFENFVSQETLAPLSLEEYRQTLNDLKKYLFVPKNFNSIVESHPGFFSMFAREIQTSSENVNYFLKQIENFNSQKSRLEEDELLSHGKGFIQFFTAQIPTKIELTQKIEEQILNYEIKNWHFEPQVSLRSRLNLKKLSPQNYVDMLQNTLLSNQNIGEDKKAGNFYRTYTFFKKLGLNDFVNSQEFNDFMCGVKIDNAKFWENIHTTSIASQLKPQTLEQVLLNNKMASKNYVFLKQLDFQKIKNNDLLINLVLTTPAFILEKCPEEFWQNDNNLLIVYPKIYDMSLSSKVSSVDIIKRKNKEFYSAKNLTLLLKNLHQTLSTQNNPHLAPRFLNHLMSSPNFDKSFQDPQVRPVVNQLLQLYHNNNQPLQAISTGILNQKEWVLEILQKYPSTQLHDKIAKPLLYSQEIALQVVKNIVAELKTSDYEKIKYKLPPLIANFLNKSALQGDVVETLEALFEKRKIKAMLSANPQKFEITYSVGKGGVEKTDIKTVEIKSNKNNIPPKINFVVKNKTQKI